MDKEHLNDIYENKSNLGESEEKDQNFDGVNLPTSVKKHFLDLFYDQPWFMSCGLEDMLVSILLSDDKDEDSGMKFV